MNHHSDSALPYTSSNLYNFHEHIDAPMAEMVMERIRDRDEIFRHEVVRRIAALYRAGIKLTSERLDELIASAEETPPEFVSLVGSSAYYVPRTYRPQVYYIRLGDLIKIGYSIHPASRAKALSLTPDHILATEPGDIDVERTRHAQFAHLRQHGEWFKAAPDLLAHIEKLKAQAA